jgi:hypothetical protein
MLYLEEISPAEASERLKLTPENLRIRKFRALSLLRSELLKKGFLSIFLTGETLFSLHEILFNRNY